MDVLGFKRLDYKLAPDAIELGLNAALPATLELQVQVGEFGRGETYRAVMSDEGAVLRFVRAPSSESRVQTA